MPFQFTQQSADEAMECLLEIGKALSKPKLREFFGHINEIACFIEVAKSHANESHDLEVHASEQ